MDIPHEKQFHFADGTAIASLDALRDKLESVSYQEFYEHVNAEKNDFANWVEHVLQDKNLAEDMRKVTSIVETVEILNDYLHPHPQGDDIQAKIEEEEDVHPPVEEVPTTEPSPEVTDDEANLEVIQESMEEPAEESHDEPEPESASEESQHEKEFVLSPREKKMLIVKDFIFGMLAGLFLGLILGRIIAIG